MGRAGPQAGRAERPPYLTQGDVDALLAARHDRPFDVLGVHRSGRSAWCVALVPDATGVTATVGRKSVPL